MILLRLLTMKNFLVSIACSLVVFSISSVWAAAFLSVESDTPTQVWVDGKVLGTTPLQQKTIAPGRHVIRYVNKEAGTQMEFSLEAISGKHFTCRYRLSTQENACTQGTLATVSPKGKLTLNSKPTATVLVDGKRMGETPVEGFVLSVGTHQIEFRLDGFESVFETVDLGEGEHKTLSVEFQSTVVPK